MRPILVQRARARKAAKRGGAPKRVTLDEGLVSGEGPAIDILALDEGLTRPRRSRPEQARIVELRYFGGMTVEETAEAVGTSPATVKRQWADGAGVAKARDRLRVRRRARTASREARAVGAAEDALQRRDRSASRDAA